MPNYAWLSKWPSGTVFLSGTAVILYLLLSQGTFYIPDTQLSGLAFFIGNPFALFSHLFVHVGVFHLVGNLIPLIAFALLLELATSSFDVVGIFIFSGSLSAILFAVLNPGTAIVGASAAIAGMMGALTALKPKQSVILLLAVPLFVSFVAIPYAATLQHKEEVKLVQAAQVLQQNVTVLVQQNKTQEAAQVNQSLQQVAQQVQITQKGRERERITPTDFFVHAYGAAFGIAYLFLFRRKKLYAAVGEYSHFFDFPRLGPLPWARKKPPAGKGRKV